MGVRGWGSGPALLSSLQAVTSLHYRLAQHICLQLPWSWRTAEFPSPRRENAPLTSGELVLVCSRVRESRVWPRVSPRQEQRKDTIKKQLMGTLRLGTILLTGRARKWRPSDEHPSANQALIQHPLVSLGLFPVTSTDFGPLRIPLQFRMEGVHQGQGSQH